MVKVSEAPRQAHPMAPLFWHQGLWQQLDQRLQAGRFPHATLLTGTAGIGKATLAQAFAARMLCQSPRSENALQLACGHCKQCALVTGEGHPDLRLIRPETGRVIKVDQIRELIRFAQQSPQVAKRKLVILDSADQLNVSAANALLKTLEEPVANTFLLLLHQGGRPLLPTIRSRCQQLRLAGPDRQQGLDWLASHNQQDSHSHGAALDWAAGAPLHALELLQQDSLGQRQLCLDALQGYLKRELDLGTAVRPFQKLTQEEALDLLLLWAHDLVRARVSTDQVRDRSAAAMLGYLAGKQPADTLHHLYEATLEARRGLIYNLNPELELMALLNQWQDLMRPSGGKSPVTR
ncbi:MAG: DNA polymerase III subunit delta' [Halomonadaceae bacterium]|nr:MAG: DNA polymerase III subunit delta' [Halomonadaceae bacterium]